MSDKMGTNNFGSLKVGIAIAERMGLNGGNIFLRVLSTLTYP